MVTPLYITQEVAGLIYHFDNNIFVTEFNYFLYRKIENGRFFSRVCCTITKLDKRGKILHAVDKATCTLRNILIEFFRVEF